MDLTEENKIKFRDIPLPGSVFDLDGTDQQMIRLLVRFPGIKVATLGRELNISSRAVRDRRRKPSVIKAMQDLNATAWEQMRDVQAKAMRTMSELLNSKNEHIKLAAASKLLAGILDSQAQSPSVTITYKTRFGDGGTMFREVMEGEAPTTIDLLKEG